MAQPQVDFYIIAEDTGNSRLLLACRLTEKAYKLGHRIYIHTARSAQAEQLDELLWSFKQNSFVPHALCTEDAVPSAHTAVLLGWQQPSAATLAHIDCDVLLNLATRVPDFFSQFNRIVEVVDQNEQVLRESRERFRYYREQGLTPTSHRL